jgi:hypothetical protein
MTTYRTDIVVCVIIYYVCADKVLIACYEIIFFFVTIFEFVKRSEIFV